LKLQAYINTYFCVCQPFLNIFKYFFAKRKSTPLGVPFLAFLEGEKEGENEK
jgi:hypothetical protein